MPKRTDINSILIIGAGPIVIGQACEFDYSGTQACKALSEPETRARLAKLGRDERPLSAAETLAFIQNEQRTWAPILQQIAAAR